MSERPADRYGDKPRQNRRWLPYALGLVVVLAGLGVAYLGYKTYGPQAIEPDRVGYTIVDDSNTSVDFKVTRKNPGTPVVCFVRAMDGDTDEVGRREVLVPGSDSGTVLVTTTIKTSRRAGAGNVYGCSDKVPAYLRAG
ncbi:DUF4307 domain-containing protein [Nocardia sp. NBC_00511]|uniref:DUF4307 domain-containing protein n=1 Tax=Nocardia sp. NBC_00511 TaxID=2903591 RepID=UPI0030E586C1